MPQIVVDQARGPRLKVPPIRSPLRSELRHGTPPTTAARSSGVRRKRHDGHDDEALPLFAATAVLGMFGASGTALAEGHDGDHGSTILEAHLTELNDSGASGTAWVMVEGNEVCVNLENTGLLAGSPRAQHIHVGGKNQCPDPNMEGSGENGAIQVSDAHDDYGMIVSSLTTEGDTSPYSGLAVDRFPVGDDAYERTFEVSDEVAADIAAGNGVGVVQGVDHNGSGEYDGDVVSDLDPNLPSEATDPAGCGVLEVAQRDWPEGGAETGDSTTAAPETPAAAVPPASAPTALRIDSIGVDEQVFPIGLGGDGKLLTPVVSRRISRPGSTALPPRGYPGLLSSRVT